MIAKLRHPVAAAQNHRYDVNAVAPCVRQLTHTPLRIEEVPADERDENVGALYVPVDFGAPLLTALDLMVVPDVGVLPKMLNELVEVLPVLMRVRAEDLALT